MLINATWRVSLGGVVLLNFNELMNDEPKLDRSFSADRVVGLGADSVRHIGRKNVSHTASFSRVKVFDTDDQAREFMRSHTLALPDFEDYCEIEWLKQFTGDTLISCILSGYKSRTENNQFIADYELRAGALLPNLIVMVSGAGNTNITATSPFLGVRAIGAVLGGGYTRTLSLLAGTVPGQLCEFFIELNTGITVEVRNLTSGGTLLHVSTGIILDYVRCWWNGTNWVAL